MAAEQLIALQAALGELGALYVVARSFVPLQAAAEADLLPRTSALGAQLRTHLREGHLDDAAVDAAAREIAALRRCWKQQLEMLHESALYRESLAAWNADHGGKLAMLLPQLLAGIAHTTVPPVLHYGVSPASARRHRGGRPFLSPEACAQKIADYRTAGIPAEATGKEWWDTELAFVSLVDEPETLDTPIALRLHCEQATAPLFTVTAEPAFRAYTRVLRIPFSVTLQQEADDEWWQAFDEPYEDYRTALAAHLERDGLAVEVWRPRGDP